MAALSHLPGPLALALFCLLLLHRCSSQSLPNPVSVAPSQYFDGDDGSWSSFAVQVGTPPQNVRVLISSSGSSLWVVLPQGCVSTDPSDCPLSRGFTFFQNESSTWVDQGLFSLLLGAEQPLGDYFGDNSDLGIDNMTLGWQGSAGPSLPHQLIAGIATKDFYLGLLGLTNRPYNVSNFNNEFPSPLVALKNNSQIPSLSWSYTAGASYRQNNYGNLVLGGYNADLIGPDVLSVDTSIDDTRDLVINIISITSSGTSLLPTSIPAFIDSTVSHIWLPLEACYLFERAFGLQLDNATQLYFVNDSLHNTLLAQNASVTFELGPIAGTARNNSRESVNITLPYSSFDLMARYPFIGQETGDLNASSRYFPLRQAANSTQYTLGRTFLQEAYLIVDYERANFSVSQVTSSDKSNLVAIVPIGYSPPAVPEGIGPGDIAGIAVGVAVVLAIAGLAIWFLIRKRRVAAAAGKEEEDKRAEDSQRSYHDTRDKDSPLMGFKSELPADNAIQPKELDTTRSSEKCALSPSPSELQGSPRQPSERSSGRVTSRDSRATATILELPGSEVGISELPGSRMSAKGGVGLGLTQEQTNGQ